MESMAPIVVVDSGIGSLCQQRGSGLDPTVTLPCGDGADPAFFDKPVFVNDGCR